MLCALSLTAAAPEQVQPMPVDASELKLKLTTDKSPVSYKAGDTIKFTVSLKYGKQKNPPPTFFLQWVRSGDDGRKDAGMDVISEDKPLTLTTVLRKPGFVWLKGKLTDQFGRTFQYIDKTGMQIGLNFDGGAGVPCVSGGCGKSCPPHRSLPTLKRSGKNSVPDWIRSPSSLYWNPLMPSSSQKIIRADLMSLR